MIGARVRSLLRVCGVVAVLSVVAGCASIGARPNSHTTGNLDSALGSIPHRSVAPIPATRLAKGLIPPTNRWFSGLVFGEAPQPVFPLPLSFGLSGRGFGFGVPAITSAADTISGEYTPAVTVDTGSKSAEVTAYDQASVTIAQRAANGTTIGSILIAEGSPVVTFTAAEDTKLEIGQPLKSAGAGLFTTSIAGLTYGLLTNGSRAGSTLSLTKKQTAVWFAVPKGGSATELAKHVSALRSVSAAYSVTGADATTTLTYHSASASLVAAMPHQREGLRAPVSCSLGSYPSVYGTLSLCAGPTLSWASPTIAASGELDTSRLTAADRAELRVQLAKDARSNRALPADSYFGGKALYRLANLLSLAHALDDTASATTLQARLDNALEKWTGAKGCRVRATQCFVYDPAAKGVVGLTASFGSDQFNDHHFHYGYFLYAASVAAKYNPSLIQRMQPVMNLLAADIATSGASKAFPERRVFDAYSGHSWASGYTPFADGNNQESSSEAVDAWNGLALWAAVTHDTTLHTEAIWMLSAEAASAKAYWTNFPTTDPVYAGYRHSVVGINWGAKRDYATWFSADPNAKLGIQLIPMSPASNYLAGDPARIAQNVREATPSGYNVALGDYLLMYSALEGKTAATAALRTARSLPDKFIDDGDSRTYLLAWIMTR